MTAEERILKISEHWFLTEPLLFPVFCTHEIVENTNLNVPFRTGQRRIEFNPDIITSISNVELTEYLKIEMFRILLKHPYQRQPAFPNKKVLTYASNITIAEIYSTIIELPGVGKWPLPEKLCFEEYYAKVFAVLSNPPQKNADTGESIISSKSLKKNNMDLEKSSTTEGNENNTVNSQNFFSDVSNSYNTLTNEDVKLEEVSELWEDNQEIEVAINDLIEAMDEKDDWGSISGEMKEQIKASMKVDMNYKRILSHFRTSIASKNRKLTRMRPNRRNGFLHMGSRYKDSSILLIAVDVSGSVSNDNLSYFFSVINSFFKYGVEKLDVIQFDYELKSSEPVELKRARKQIEVVGKGGTNFQPAADYYCAHPEYDGLIYFTDGYAPPPIFYTKRLINVLWILSGKYEYEQNKNWIRKINRNKVTYIPLPAEC